MQRYKLTIEYDGTDFAGWQLQDNVISIQEVIETAIYKFSGENARLYVSGRTDKGVHALAQIAHFDLSKDTKPNIIQNAVNYYLKQYNVRIIDAEATQPDFHARFDAISRKYQYRILNRPAPPALDINRVWHIPYELNAEDMQKAANLLIGKYDFSTFRAANCQAKSPIKSLTHFDIEKSNQEIHFNVQAPSFLYHQVRNMVGTLILIGNGKWDIQDFKNAFDAKDRKRGGITAPPQGLYFVNVNYN